MPSRARSTLGQTLPPAGRQRRKPWGPRGEAGEAAVTEVLGSILLVGITVVTAAGLGLLILSFEGPEDTLHTNLELRVDPGADSQWDSGDEKVQLRHLGGEALGASETTVAVENGATSLAYTGSALASAFSDGELTIGETWESPASLDLDRDEAVAVDVVNDVGQSSLVASGLVTGHGILVGGTATCSSDVLPPSASVTQDPADVSIVTLDTTLEIRAVLSDGCAGVDPDIDPTLKWEFDDSTPDANSIVMTHDPDVDTSYIWKATLPAQTWLSWSGHTLYYQVTGFQDLRFPTANAGSSSVFSDSIGVSYTYVDTASMRVGTVDDITRAQAESDSLSTTFTKGAVGSSLLEGNTASGTMANPTRALTSNNQYATSTTANQYVQVTGFDVPTAATGIRSVVLGLEAHETTAAGADPTLHFEWRVGSTGSFQVSAATLTFSGVTDADQTVDITNFRDWSVADVESLQVRAVLNANDISVNAVYLSVTEAIPSGTAFAMNAVLDFADVPDTTLDLQTLQIRYQATGDTFDVQVWDPTANSGAGGFTTRAGTTASCSGSQCYSYALTAAEYNGGDPRIRILGATPTATSTATFAVDYARVWSQ